MSNRLTEHDACTVLVTPAFIGRCPTFIMLISSGPYIAQKEEIEYPITGYVS